MTALPRTRPLVPALALVVIGSPHGRTHGLGNLWRDRPSSHRLRLRDRIAACDRAARMDRTGARVKISFQVDGEPAEFRLSLMAGKAALAIAGDLVMLQSPLNPMTHVSISTTRTWRHQTGGHSFEITKRRPVFLAPFRANEFSVVVGGRLVATAKGR